MSLKGYQIFLRPFLLPQCRFYPSCSEYAIEAYQTHSLAHATFLATSRVSRCRPWGGHGYDPVPHKVMAP